MQLPGDTDLDTHTVVVDVAASLNAPPFFAKWSLLTATLYPAKLMYNNSDKKWLRFNCGGLRISAML